MNNKNFYPKTQKSVVFSECMLRLDVLRVLCCSVCVLQASLSWCPKTCHVYIVVNISMNISSITSINLKQLLNFSKNVKSLQIYMIIMMFV